MKSRTPRRDATTGLLWESVPDLLYRVRGADGTIQLLSAAFATHTGWSVAEWIGRPFAELVYPDDLPQAKDRYASILRGEKPARYELRLRTRAGGFVVGEFHSAPFIERGRVVGEQGIARDITDRRRAEEAREAREERFRTLFESTDEAMFLMDGAVFVDLNPRCLEMFGLHDRSDMIGRSPLDFSPPRQPDGGDSREKALDYILAALQGCPQRFYWKHARKDGSTFDAEVSLHPLTLYGRVHVQATVRDITARRAAEEAMRASERRFRLLAAQVPADVWTTDAALRLTSISGSLVPPVDRLDLRKAGSTLYNLFATRDESHPVIAAHRRALGGVSAQYERTAGPMVIEGRVEPLRDGAGAVVGCVGVALDITERRSAQNALRRLADFVESSEDAIVTTTLDGTIETWNPAAERLFGHRAREAVGRPVTLIAPEESAADLKRNLRLLKEGHSIGPYETQLARSDGTVINVSATLSPIRDARGALAGSSRIFRDVTAQKRAEHELRQSEAFYRSLFENLSDCIFILDVTPDQRFKIVSFNPAEERAVGMTTAQVAGRFTDDLFPKGMAEQLNGNYRRCLEERRITHYEEVLDLPKGKVPFLTTLIPLAAANGRIHRIIGVASDISERKQTEQALQASETHYRSLIEHGTDQVTIMGADGRFTYASPSVTRLLGYDPRELIGQVGFGYVHPDDVAKVQAAFGRALQGETAELREVFRFRHKDGSWRVFESVVTNLLGEPTVAGVVINSRDVTDRTRAEEALRQEQFLVSTLMENIPDSIYFKDAASRFVRINRNMARLFGLSDPAQAVGKTDFDFFAPDHARAALETEREVMRTGQPAVDIEELETWPDRPDTWVSSTKMPLRDAAGVIIGTFGISRDITKRKGAEEALRRSEADHRGLVDHAPLGVYRSTRDGRFLTVNAALVSMLGYDSAEELLRLDMGRDVYADPEERERAIRESRPHVEVEWKRRDGTRILVQLSSRAIPGPPGEGECFEGMVQDVTEQRSIENQFRQAQRLEAVGRLAGGVAHDFNNVLTAITGYSDLLIEALPPGDPKREDVLEIRAAAQRAAGLTRQLLAFSRKQVLQTSVLDLNAVVRTLEKMLQRLIGEDVKLETSLSSALGAVRADPGQLEQVILNLAVNSRDAMPGGGRLTIETANVELDEAYAREHPGVEPGRYVMLAMSDTGIGMSAETRSHIFEPFFTTKEVGKGTGLGLATVYGIVKQSGGHVWVYSEPERGATFKIYLPQVDELPEPASPASPVEPAAGGRETVLLAEDDSSVRAVVSDVLTQKGYRVLRAPDGQSALEMARAQPGEIHLLVTDLVMPGMTGRELAEALKAQRPGVRVLYMSGYTDDAVVRHGVLAQGLPYLQKPFTPAALAHKVRELLDRA
jgi:PAS domain S-box-containing protein